MRNVRVLCNKTQMARSGMRQTRSFSGASIGAFVNHVQRVKKIEMRRRELNLRIYFKACFLLLLPSPSFLYLPRCLCFVSVCLSDSESLCVCVCLSVSLSFSFSLYLFIYVTSFFLFYSFRVSLS